MMCNISEQFKVFLEILTFSNLDHNSKNKKHFTKNTSNLVYHLRPVINYISGRSVGKDWSNYTIFPVDHKKNYKSQNFTVKSIHPVLLSKSKKFETTELDTVSGIRYE